MNATLQSARQFDENCPYPKAAAKDVQIERLSASGVMLRGPGAARWPDAV